MRGRPLFRGYTLIELLIVVGLLGLSGALLVPHLVQQDSMTVQAAVRRVIADLSFAQSDALAHQEFRRIHFYPDGSGYCILRVTGAELTEPFLDLVDPDYIVDPLSPGQSENYIVLFSEDARFRGVTITSVDIDGSGEGIGAAGADVKYDELGGTLSADTVPGSGGTIELNAGDDTYEIRLAPFTGKMTVVEQ